MLNNKKPNGTTGATVQMATPSMASSNLTTLHQMPIEILINVVKSIGVEDIREGLKAVTRFAMTSKQSLIVVEAAVGSLKELRSLEKRFGTPCFEVSSAKDALSEIMDFEKVFPNISPKSSAPDLAYLNLNGSLSWLPSLDSVLENGNMIDSYYSKPVMKKRSLKKLLTQAESLHLKIPPSFLTLANSEVLQRRIPGSDDTHFSFGSLIRCSPRTDRNAGGYVLGFLTGYSWAAYLYLDTMGQHCVLYSSEDICPEDSDEDSEKDEDEDKVEDKEEVWRGDAITLVKLEALDFEEYIYHLWIDELGWKALPPWKKISEAQMAYLERIQ